jgi:hypothetical protein
MNRTFGTMKSNVGTLVGDTSSAMQVIIGNFLNNRLAEVLKRSNLLDVNRSDYQFTTTAGTEDYALPQDFGKELTVRDVTQGQWLSRTDTQSNVMMDSSSTDSQGAISKYIILDKTVLAQPTAASVVTITSSSASDTSQTVYVKGLDSNGYEDYETASLSSTSNVVTTKLFSRIFLISKSAVTAGNITFTTNSGAVTVAVMSRAILEHRRKIMRLVSIPGTSSTIEINYLQHPMPMSQDYDYPIIDCADVLEAGAECDAWRFKRQFGKAADMDIVFEKRLANLLFDYANQPNQLSLFKPRTYSANMNNGNITDNRYGIF